MTSAERRPLTRTCTILKMASTLALRCDNMSGVPFSPFSFPFVDSPLAA
jgi:hypothetical protein